MACSRVNAALRGRDAHAERCAQTAQSKILMWLPSLQENRLFRVEAIAPLPIALSLRPGRDTRTRAQAERFVIERLAVWAVWAVAVLPPRGWMKSLPDFHASVALVIESSK